jgi:hypothetical protein
MRKNQREGTGVEIVNDGLESSQLQATRNLTYINILHK